MAIASQSVGTRGNSTLSLLIAALLLPLVAGCSDSSNSSMDTTAAGDDILMNQLQYLGSHNSYHVRAKQDLFDLLLVFYPGSGANVGLLTHSTAGAV